MISDPEINNTIKPKRGRRPKNVVEVEEIIMGNENGENTNDVEDTTEEKKVCKKRGRKPKGGKLVTRIMDETTQTPPVENVVLHLKCSLKDLNICTNTNEIVKDPFIYNPSAPNEIITYNEDTLYKSYTTIDNDNDTQVPNAYTEPYCKKCKCIENGATSSIEEYDEKVSMKDITAKLKKLKIS